MYVFCMNTEDRYKRMLIVKASLPGTTSAGVVSSPAMDQSLLPEVILTDSRDSFLLYPLPPTVNLARGRDSRSVYILQIN